MARYMIRRMSVSILVLFVISIGIFTLLRMAPGDPVDLMLPPEARGPGTEALLDAKRAELGLDKPLPIQYGIWLRDAFQGDLGYSISTGRPVAELIGERIGPTVYLMSLSLLLALLISIPLGLLSAVRKGKPVDYAASAVTLGAICTPSFFVAILCIYVFALKLRVLPSAGMSNPGNPSIGDSLLHLIMPMTILAFASSGALTRYVRSSVIGELRTDYVRTAEAKGAGRSRVLTRHVLRNALIPLITVVALNLPYLLAGAVVIETVFAWPGMGQLTVNAVGKRDYPIIIAFAMMVAILTLLSNLIADLLYTVVDPRVRLR
ncbi:ABC transporter permease [Micromonospora sp. DR5-3]|uniref:ABC transporter permease n=1 Tax=unclassified Micromonospora TaxID=2617518 RepID=UPI0011DAFC4A|nr:MULTISPECIES: ABC transporter permease [unclassified Micromonospora]MCW3818897.1 ABC transporter permease [Micromonospora sp. DR5-3]TYC20923.1 ABC transporter permease [Micromonospora sp. MP36]